MSKQFYFQYFSLAFTHFTSIWPMDRTLSGATTPSQSEPGSDGNEGVIHIHQSSSITGTSPSDGLVSYPGHSLQRCWASVHFEEQKRTWRTTYTQGNPENSQIEDHRSRPIKYKEKINEEILAVLYLSWFSVHRTISPTNILLFVINKKKGRYVYI